MEGQTVLKGSFCCSSRFALIVMGFFGFINLYALRVNMSVAIVCMTRKEDTNTNTSRASPITGRTTFPQSNFTTEYTIKEKQKIGDTFDWDKNTQGLILGSFFIGYILTQIPGAWLTGKYGGKVLYGWSMILCVTATLLTPLAARTDIVLLIAMRAFIGMCQGVAIPCMQTLLTYWIPPLQRSMAVGFVYAGMQVGVMITFPVCGVLCVDGFDGGWPSIFYILGCFGFLWCLAWMYIVYDRPVSHPRISMIERIYIADTLKSEVDISKRSFHTPWLKILTSLPVWAIIITHTCSEWGAYTFLTNIPTYMEEILKYDINKAGLLASLPYLCFSVVSNMSALMADFLRRRGYLSTTATRKIFTSIGNIIPALCTVIMGYVADNPGTAVAMLTVGLAMTGCQYGSGYVVNPIDIAPRYAGIILAISNTAGSLGGFFAPFAIGMITTDKTKEQWKIVFYVTAAVYVFGSIFFVMFGSGELQHWALHENRTIEVKEGKPNSEVKNVDEETTDD